MIYFSSERKLSDVLNELWAELKEKLLGPENELQPIPVRNKN